AGGSRSLPGGSRSLPAALAALAATGAAAAALAEQLGGGTEAQRGVGDLEHVVLLGPHEGDVGGHAGLELELLVVDVDDGVVGDDVLHGLRGVADLAHLAAEALG